MDLAGCGTAPPASTALRPLIYCKDKVFMPYWQMFLSAHLNYQRWGEIFTFLDWWPAVSTARYCPAGSGDRSRVAEEPPAGMVA